MAVPTFVSVVAASLLVTAAERGGEVGLRELVKSLNSGNVTARMAAAHVYEVFGEIEVTSVAGDAVKFY